jgi:hypothetical protein
VFPPRWPRRVSSTATPGRYPQNSSSEDRQQRSGAGAAIWYDGRRLGSAEIDAISAAAYVEQLGTTASKPSVKQHLAAIRQLSDYLVTGILERTIRGGG